MPYTMTTAATIAYRPQPGLAGNMPLDMMLTCMVQSGNIHQVSSALIVLTEQPMRSQQSRAAHAAPCSELTPHAPRNS